MSREPLVYLALSEAVSQKVEKVLKRFSCRVRKIPDGEALIELAREEPPDLIILEKDLPRLDGYAAVLLLKNNEETADIPILGICKCVSEAETEKARDAGCDDYVCYPFEEEELEKILTNYLVR